MHAFSRTEMLLGKEGLAVLGESKVAIFGVGGVGTYVAEALIRAGIGSLVLVDDDTICLTNTNRQLHTLRSTIGRSKVEAMRDRLVEINPEIKQEFYLPENADSLMSDDYSYIVDALDTVSAKIDLVLQGQVRNIPVISAMGAGNKLDPTKIKQTDVFKTKTCPLAKVMRKELRKRGIKKLKVVYSEEEPIKPKQTEENSCQSNCICPSGSVQHCLVKRAVPGSISYVPGIVGLMIAGTVVNDLLKSTK